MLWVMMFAGLGLAWWQDRRQLDLRLQKIEQMYAPTMQSLWSAKDVLGAPDDPTGIAGKSWCPAYPQGVDWVQVGFDRSVAAVTIEVHETYFVGCVKEVFVVDAAGNETSIWTGTDPTPATSRAGVFSVPVPKSTKSVRQVKIVVDSINKGSYPCLDAVGLTTADGQTFYATSSSCSTVYGSGDLTASIRKGFWSNFW
jgi:hypothetical protein